MLSPTSMGLAASSFAWRGAACRSPAGRPPASPAPAAEGEEEDPKERPREEPVTAGEDGKQNDAGDDHHQRHQPDSLRREGGALARRPSVRSLAALLTGPPLGRQV